MKTYSELIKLKTFIERYNYLKLNGSVGESTFGFDRHLNQRLYHSGEWKSIRNRVIIRDEGCDMGVRGYEILDKIFIHHMNPITPLQMFNGDDLVFNLDNLICVSERTHLAIHFGDEKLLPKPLIQRYPGDTTLW